MKSNTTITTNTSVKIADVIRPQGLDAWEASIVVSGSFGGGTIKFQLSPDAGTTLIDLKDASGVVVSLTSADVYNIRLGNSNKNFDQPTIYANLAGSTAAAVAIAVFDNR